MRVGQPLKLRRALVALSLVGIASLHSGCAAMHDGFEASAHAVPSPGTVAAVEQAKPVRLDVKTVRSTDSTDAPIVVAAAVPSPKEIFDFHPAGSAPGSFRQPFDIDVDGR